MTKYKNVTNHRIFLTQGKKIVEISPNEILTLSHNPFPGKLVEYYDEDESPEDPDPLEDSIVIVSDALIKELQEDKSKSEKRTRKRKT